MAGPAHKDHTKHFKELTYAEQAKSITASINNLSKSIKHHIKYCKKHAKDPAVVKQKCLKQLDGMICRLKNTT